MRSLSGNALFIFPLNNHLMFCIFAGGFLPGVVDQVAQFEGAGPSIHWMVPCQLELQRYWTLMKKTKSSLCASLLFCLWFMVNLPMLFCFTKSA